MKIIEKTKTIRRKKKKKRKVSTSSAEKIHVASNIGKRRKPREPNVKKLRLQDVMPFSDSLQPLSLPSHWESKHPRSITN